MVLRAAALEVTPALDEDVRARAGEMRAGVTAAAKRLREIVGLPGEPVPDSAGSSPARQAPDRTSR
ncbi:hypothetical protein [Amycolatopsis keratiniphila]|uniref:hypothetical protein n=1 Tax=Amycolatopsis keratiniphila TaxID=129921 RepID=UPI0007AD3435|nr:hypothetical protein [Amycolatopsis keratiniphila]